MTSKKSHPEIQQDDPLKAHARRNVCMAVEIPLLAKFGYEANEESVHQHSLLVKKNSITWQFWWSIFFLDGEWKRDPNIPGFFVTNHLGLSVYLGNPGFINPSRPHQLSNFLGTPGEENFHGNPEKFQLLFPGDLVG